MRIKAQLGGVLYGHNPFAGVNLARERVEERGLARPGASGYCYPLSRPHGPAQQLRVPFRQRAQLDQRAQRRDAVGESPDGDHRPAYGNRVRHGVHAVAVGKARVHDGAAPVEPSPKGCQNSVDHDHDLLG